MKVICLEMEGLAPFTTSPQAYVKSLQECIDNCEAQYGSLVTVVERTIGRTSYHFGLYSGGVEPIAVEAKATKAKATKAKPEQV